MMVLISLSFLIAILGYGGPPMAPGGMPQGGYGPPQGQYGYGPAPGQYGQHPQGQPGMPMHLKLNILLASSL